VSGITESPDFAAAARQIAGQARSYSFGVNQQHAAYRQIAILGLF
jgi:hypothetical protein